MKAHRSTLFWLALGGLCAAGVFAWQQHGISQLKREIASLRAASNAGDADSATASIPVPQSPAAITRVDRVPAAAPDARLERRVAALEASVSLLGEGADHLMDRGAIPPSDAKLAEWASTFNNVNAATQDRLLALRQLCRNRSLAPALAQMAASWLSTETDTGVARSILEAVRGAADPALKTAILAIASSAEDPRLRDRAISSLRDYSQDPQAEALLWELASADPSEIIRRRAEDTLRRIPMTDERTAALELRALNSSASLDERLASLRLLERGEKDIARVAPALSQVAQSVTDAESLLKLYRAFDDVNDPAFMLPLVQGAQYDNVDVRLRATDALVDYRAEPAIAELLQAMAKTDPDPRVRQEASRIFREDRR